MKQRWHFTNTASQPHADHQPPHFHARYGAAEVLVEIDSGLVHGAFPPRALRLVLEWRNLHLKELQEDWQRCQDQEPLIPIAPLE
ncbi:MAG: DUF4160 domain-containing protein [Cyanobacteria bacterium K_DeepCast_35m_m1_288]|nr:DUF4160 domain-containing protein [Cyanobacteria bacterium K_DeepCast_35m_m1_288]